MLKTRILFIMLCWLSWFISPNTNITVQNIAAYAINNHHYDNTQVFYCLKPKSESDTEPTEPPPTTTPPGGETPPAPRYQITLLGNFTSLDGDDFTIECMEALGENFRYKAALMIPDLNNMLGEDMCDYVNVGDVQIMSMSAQLTTSASAVSVNNFTTAVQLQFFNTEVLRNL